MSASYSPLRLLVSAPIPRGGYFWISAEEFKLLRRKLRRRKAVELRCLPTMEKTEILSTLKGNLPLPDYVADNWDSLHECLLDLASPHLLLVLFPEHLRMSVGDPLLSVLGEAASLNSKFCVILVYENSTTTDASC